MLKQPIKTLTKELSKFIPFLGQVVAPSISVVMLEAAGWTLAKELEVYRPQLIGHAFATQAAFRMA